MTTEFENQIRQRLNEIEALLKTLPKDTLSRYRVILSEEVIRLRRELTNLAPLDNDSYLLEENQNEDFEVNEEHDRRAYDNAPENQFTPDKKK